MEQAWIYGLVLASALAHAAWNAFMKSAPEPLVVMSGIRACGLAYGIVALPIVGLPNPESWSWLLLSVPFHFAYYAALTFGYCSGDLSFVYPIARGTVPLLVAGIAWAVLDEPANASQIVGVFLISLGVLSLAMFGHGGARALGLAAATGGSIALYSCIGGVGVRDSGNVLGFHAMLEVITGTGMLLFMRVKGGRALCAELRRTWRVGLGAGALSVGGYLTYLFAVDVLPLAPVIALRECSAVIGVVLGATVLHEAFGWRRTFASVLAGGGITLLVLS